MPTLVKYSQLERLNAEQAARTKRERRRANEVKTKTIQRMQLQMTAPMDIGMEQHDASLGYGQEDVFDLTGAERGMKRKGGVTMLTGDGYDMPESDESGPEGDGEGEDEELLDSEEERERKVAGLEAELDGMYDAYQERLKERDAKFKVTEERRKNGLLEEWHGIQKDSDEDSESEEEGGWDKMEEAKGEGWG